MSRVLIFGNKSFIQNNLFVYLKKNKINAVKKKFSELKQTIFLKKDLIINCSNSVNFFSNNYSKSIDRSYLIANAIKKKDVRLLLFSTRMVYKPKKNIHESSKLLPVNNYGMNCLYSEISCKKILKKKLTILRISNVIGYEIRKKRQSLMSMLIKGIKKKEIILDNSYNFEKDILPINFFCRYIFEIIKLNYSGLINLGSGVSLTPLDIAKILTLKKKINIKISSTIQNNFDNSYNYNIKKLVKLTKIKYSKLQVLNELRKISAKL